MEIVSGKLSAGELNPRGIAKYRPNMFGASSELASVMEYGL